jgi:pimeloyl-ACP methyl ester carboxylesterase
MKFRVFIFALIFALTLMLTSPAAAQDCPTVEGIQVTCGFLPVPENRTRADSPTIQIAYAVVHSRSETPQPDPVVFIAGGPGNSGTAQMSGVVELLTDVLEARDLIFFDQRGVGFSQPSLDCTPDLIALAEGDSAALLNVMAQSELRNTAAQNCISRFTSQGIDLAAYNTTQSAADLDALRAALGYEQWNLYGVSYGTYFALTVMRDYPAGIRSVVLDSVVPLQANPFAADSHHLDMVFAGCAADWICNAAYPLLGTVYQEVVADLNANPLNVLGILINGDTLDIGLSTAASQTFIIPYIPSLIYDLRDRDTRKLEILLSMGGAIGSLSAMPFAYLCGEEAPFTSVEQAGVTTEICDGWQVIDERANEPVSSDIPTLLLAGQYDTSTPPAWAHLAAETLTHNYVYEFPGTGHVVIGNPSSTCPAQIVTNFFNTPTQTPDTSCISQMRAMSFVLRPQVSEPYALFGMLILSVGVVMPTSYALFKQHWTLAWRAAFRNVGWQIPFAAFTAIIIGLLFMGADATREGGVGLPGRSMRVAEVVLTLMIGMQSAFAFAPDDEASLEIMAACPRPLYYILLERLVALFTVYGGIGTIAAVITLSLMSGDNLLLATVRWLAPALLATGIITRITVLTRRASFGLLVAIMLFFTLLLGGALLVQLYPVLSPIYPFLQPDEVPTQIFVLNRLCVSIIGLALIISAGWLTRSEERMLRA